MPRFYIFKLNYSFSLKKAIISVLKYKVLDYAWTLCYIIVCLFFCIRANSVLRFLLGSVRPVQKTKRLTKDIRDLLSKRWQMPKARSHTCHSLYISSPFTLNVQNWKQSWWLISSIPFECWKRKNLV